MRGKFSLNWFVVLKLIAASLALITIGRKMVNIGFESVFEKQYEEIIGATVMTPTNKNKLRGSNSS
jgi:hypothetical protein